MSHRSYVLCGAAIAALTLYASAAAAQAGAAATTTTSVGEVVVTATSLEETLPMELSRYGNDVAVIGRETIRNNIYADPSQALQMQTPGLYLAPRAGPFSYVDIALQGSRIGDVLWTVDGVRINNRLYTSTSPADTLPAAMIERIEVLKGGQSLFYGTNAAAGVINVVTRSFSDQFGGEINVGGDTNETVRVNGYVRGGAGGHQFVAFASKDQSDGYEIYDAYQPSATMRNRRYDVINGGLKYGVDLAPDMRLQAQYMHTRAELGYPNPRLTAYSANNRNEDIAAVRLDYTPDGPAQFFLKGYYHDWDTLYDTVNNDVNNPGRYVVVNRDTFWGYRDYGVNALAKLRLHRGFEYNVGYDFQNYKGRDDVLLIAEQAESVHAVFGQVRTTEDLIDNASFAAGVRYNNTSESSTTVWNVSGRYDFTDALYVEGTGGTALVLPSAEQLFGIDPCCAAGNPNLKAERSLNFNASVGGRALGATGVSWQVTGFWRDIDNLIAEGTSSPAFPNGTYVNAAGKVTAKGVEVVAGATLGGGWRMDGSFTYTRTRERGAGLQFARIPVHSAKASIVYAPSDHPFGASLTGIWIGDVFSPVTGFGRQNYGNYAVVDVAAHVFIDGTKRKHRVTGRVENIFDERYATRINSQLIDRSTQRFLVRNLGMPRTFHLNYSYAF
jgi:outer membrane cobalamin receptor